MNFNKLNEIINRKSVSINNKKIIVETSLNRLKSHTKNGFFIISAFRGEYSENENLKRHKELKKDIRNKKLGFIELYGKWVETNEKTNVRETKSEISLFVPYRDIITSVEFYSIATDLMFKYDQEAIVFRGTEPEDKILILDQSENEIYSIGNFNPDKISEVYSTIRYGSHAGRNFIFEGVIKPSNFVDALSKNKSGTIL